MDNYDAVLQQMQAFGVRFRKAGDLPLKIDTPKSKTCGVGGKWWYKLYTFQREQLVFIVGSFGSYKTGDSQKVEVDWKPLAQAERQRLQAQHAAAKAAEDEARRQEAELAALGAADLWLAAHKSGESKYLTRKGVTGEACRYLHDGSIVIPLLRYDQPRESALRGVQRIFADGAKRFTKGFAKTGCALRLGTVVPGRVILVCEGYATGLTLRMATSRMFVVYVALDAGNLVHAVPLLRELHSDCPLLICGDDDHLTRDQQTGKLNNPGRTTARKVAKTVEHCDFLWPVFAAATRGPKDTDFNDLHARQGLDAVTRQINSVLHAMGQKYDG